MKKILLIEDEKELREGVAEMLTYEGYNIYQADDGCKGLKIALMKDPDIILCDILMPDMNGYEVLKKLKKNDSKRLVPFIFLTALSERNNFRQGMELGADDYLTKPFTRKELLNAISSRIEKYSDLEKQIKGKIKNIENDLKYKITNLSEEINEKSRYINKISTQKATLDRQLKEKELELMQEVLNVIETNNTIHNLVKIISAKLKNTNISDEQRKLLLELKNQINKKTILSNSWTVFQLKFNQVYPNFISNLTSHISGLTQYDLVFISATLMGLTTFQIADMLNISDGSVRKSRHRIKKKLGLSKCDDFLKYIHSFNRVI